MTAPLLQPALSEPQSGQSVPSQPEPGMAGATHPEEFWRSLFYFNLYRLVVACGVVVITWIFRDAQFGSHHPRLFFFAALSYILFSGFSLLLIGMRRPRFNWQLAIQVGGDVMFLVILTYASGGVQSGLGLLLLASLAAAGLVSRGKLALFFASVASIGMLLEETYAFLYADDYQVQYVQAGLLSMGYFAVAWLAHRLAKYALVSEQLALQRGIDLASMAQVNQLVIQDMQDGVLVVDENGKIRQRNLQAEKLVGMAPGISATPAPMLADYAPVLAARLKLWYENASTAFDLLRIPASNALVRTRFVPVKGKGKGSNRAGAVIFLEDMGRIQAQAQQMKLAALGRLTANIAHEIRNPLSAISHAAELLEEEQNLSPTHPRLLQIIGDNTRRLNKMVQDVLQLNRRDRSAPETFPAADFLRTFIADFCHAERIDIETFVLDVAEQQGVNFDRGHLNQVLWNLCHNAWRHCRKQRGSIRLRISRRAVGAAAAAAEDSLNLDVIDDGPGVAPAVRGQLFEPFFTTAASGTGLGLYIAREMCEANGATLDCLEDATGGHFRIVCRSNPNHG